MQLCSKPRGARGIEPETFRRRGQLLSQGVSFYHVLRPLDILCASVDVVMWPGLCAWIAMVLVLQLRCRWACAGGGWLIAGPFVSVYASTFPHGHCFAGGTTGHCFAGGTTEATVEQLGLLPRPQLDGCWLQPHNVFRFRHESLVLCR